MRCLLFIGFLVSLLVDAKYEGRYVTISSWINQFDNLPKNRQGADAAKHSGFWACGDKQQQWQEFEQVLSEWLTIVSTHSLSKDSNWELSNTYETKPADNFFDVTSTESHFYPFAQKLILQPEEIVYIRGDLHGDIFSLLEQIKDLVKQGVLNNYFKIIKPYTRLAFLGDYVDRGQYGCEVLYTMMRLAIVNPDRMIYTRGNHEDIALHKKYGFKQEVIDKFDDIDGHKHKQICKIYDFMPVVCYIGCQSKTGIVNYIQSCHGGIELGYSPQSLLDSDKQYQLLGKLNRQIICEQLLSICSYKDQIEAVSCYMLNDIVLKNPRNPDLLGFMWNDFDVLNEQQLVYNHLRRGGFVYGKSATQDVLTLQSSHVSKIKGVMRAHQHTQNPDDCMMQGLVGSCGVYRLWQPYQKESDRSVDDGLVWTYNVGPDTEYGKGVGFDFDTYAALTVRQEYKDWTLHIYNTQVI